MALAVASAAVMAYNGQIGPPAGVGPGGEKSFLHE
jgi:hypothetical protein